MKKALFLVPVHPRSGLTTVALGMVRAFDRLGVRVAFYKPLAQRARLDHGPERSTHFVQAATSLRPAAPIEMEHAERLVADHRRDELMNLVVAAYHESSPAAEVVVVEGLVEGGEKAFAADWNADLVSILGADVVLVASAAGISDERLFHDLENAANPYGGWGSERIAGCIVNRVAAPASETPAATRDRLQATLAAHARGRVVPVIGAIPENPEITRCRTSDVAAHLNATVVRPGAMHERRVQRISLLARSVPNMLGYFQSGSILVTPSDRSDVVVAVAMAALNHVPIAGLVLTGDVPVDEAVLKFCEAGFASGLPLLKVETDSYTTAVALHSMSEAVPIDDVPRIESAMNTVAGRLDEAWLLAQRKGTAEPRLSPAAFCYQLTERARQADRRILLPEGSEPRTIRAAAICQQRGIARCALLGKPAEIRRVAAGLGVELPPGLELVDSEAVRSRYVQPLYEMRKAKGLSLEAAADQLIDEVVLGTMMLALGEADGLVSGAVHSTANTIRPALQIIKTKPGTSVVSSVFFMCLPEQVVVYGDCAVVADPDAPTLADIAIQSAESARQFGIEPRVAMISYSTGESGSGAQVDKVREATRIAQTKRPDLLIDGPLQYDAASTLEVGRAKAPDSPVAGRATVFIFPDLNTGNSTYKAVQRSAHVVSVGPMLQGLKRPVNDLSRGALVEDIVYTIALTAIQAAELPPAPRG